MSNAHEKEIRPVGDKSRKEIRPVIQHKSSTLTVKNANTLFHYFNQVYVFKEDQILLTNLISNLCDSTNCIRGKNSRFETLLED